MCRLNIQAAGEEPVTVVNPTVEAAFRRGGQSRSDQGPGRRMAGFLQQGHQEAGHTRDDGGRKASPGPSLDAPPDDGTNQPFAEGQNTLRAVSPVAERQWVAVVIHCSDREYGLEHTRYV